MVISRRHTRSFGSRALSIVGGLVLCLHAAEPAFPQDPAGNDRAAQSADPGQGPTRQADAPDTQARNQALSFGFVMLGAIIVGGTLLLALVVIWGNRTRRMARSPLPPVSKRDELWFLKPKKGPADDTGENVESDPKQGTGPGTN